MDTNSHPKPREAVILAGGLGTRLRSLKSDLPKPMMPVCGRPFIGYLLQILAAAGIERTVLALGYRAEAFRSHFGPEFSGMALIYSVEETPLGTGGGLARAVSATAEENLVVLNGDSYFHVDIANIFAYHVKSYSDITIALKQLDDCSRFGTVSVSDGRIERFREKGFTGSGRINGGVYVVNRRIFARIGAGEAFSFERDVLEKRVGELVMLPYACDGFFIDIGTPDDFRRAQREFCRLMGATR